MRKVCHLLNAQVAYEAHVAEGAAPSRAADFPRSSQKPCQSSPLDDGVGLAAQQRVFVKTSARACLLIAHFGNAQRPVS